MTGEPFRETSSSQAGYTSARSGIPQTRISQILVPQIVVPRANDFSGIGVLLVLAATYFLYAPAARFPFVYDDVFQIAQNPHLDSWRFLPIYFTQHVWSHVPQIPANFYRPLFLLWLRLNNVLFDREPAGWHSTAILLHLVATGLSYLFARAILKNRAGSLLAALLFGIHPVHTEAVAWISGVPEPLNTVFFLGSFLCYLRLRADASHRRLWLAGSLVLFAAALLSKETAAVLPILIAAYELTLGKDRSSPATSAVYRMQNLLPYGVVLALYLLVRAAVLGEFTHRMTSVPPTNSLLTLPWLLCFYARQLVWPSHLSPLYDVTYVSGMAQLGFILPLLAVICVSVAVWRLTLWCHSGLPSFLCAWFVTTLAPALLIFCVALPAEGFHDRYLYLPSLALAMAVGAIFASFWESKLLAGKSVAGAVAVIVAAVVVCATLAFSTHRQIGYWASNYVLFQRAVEVAPRNEIANLNFASELLKTREYRRALQLSEEVVASHPESARAMASAAAASSFLGSYRQAEAYYVRAIQIDSSQASLFQSLGLTRMKLGLYKSAQDALRQALMVDPKQPGVHFALGLTDIQLGQWQEAERELQAEIRDDPANENAQKALLEAERQLQNRRTKPVLSRVTRP
jgi:tetratricopeptide (TPR) repeat protein